MRILTFLFCVAALSPAAMAAFPAPSDPAADTTVMVDVEAGWNIISLPLFLSQTHKDSLFPTSTSNAFYYNAGYVGDDSLEIGKGYWLKFAGAASIPLFGSAVHQDTFAVSAGWNLVGSIGVPVNTAGVTTVPGGVTLSRFWGYDKGYVHASSINPGGGYWVKASGAGSIVLDAGAAASPRAARDPYSEFNTLVIEDARGMRQTLRFGEASAMTAGDDSEMPPPPPGLFDARFAGGTWVEFYGGGESDRFTAMVSSAAWPVTIRWEIAPGDKRALALNGSVRMTGKGSAVIGTRGPIEITAEATAVPGAYALRQNYPNPFNPSTKISFDLPEPSEVRLTVYDMLGRRVAVLVDGVSEPGTHTVGFDATGHPSGLYFYKLDAGRFSDTRKMMILK